MGKLMKKILFILLAFIGLAVGVTVGVQAQESDGITTEKWRCFDPLDFSKETVLGVLSRVTGGSKALGTGEVSVAGMTYKASFKIIGFDRRWDFGEKLEYSFFIEPEGTGLYYDFSDVKDGGKTRQSQTYSCVSP